MTRHRTAWYFPDAATGVSQKFGPHVILAGQSSPDGDTDSNPASSNVIHYPTCSSPKIYDFMPPARTGCVSIIPVSVSPVKISSGDSEAGTSYNLIKTPGLISQRRKFQDVRAPGSWLQRAPIGSVPKNLRWWAILGSNQGPQSYQN